MDRSGHFDFLYGKSPYFDVTVCNPLQDSLLSQSAVVAALWGEVEKDACHEKAVLDAGGIFIPLAVETLGLWSPASRTEHSIGQHPSSDQSGQTWTNMQLSFLPNYLPIVVPNENMIMNEQCDFADGICNDQEFSKVSLMNWGTQPQVFRKGTVIGHLEQASIATYNDPIWKD